MRIDLRQISLVVMVHVAACATPAWAQRPLGIDVSHYQPTINWTQVYNSGRVFMFTKATEGTGYTDAYMNTHMTNARAAGLLAGVYHFGRPDLTGNTATGEADYFMSVAGRYMAAGYLRPVLDLEAGSGNLSGWVNTFCNRVLTVKGVSPLVYTRLGIINSSLNSTNNVWPLWIAAWLTNANPQTGNPSTGVWPTWTFWQYSDSGSVPGISGGIDVDVFNGTYAQLLTYVIGDPAQIYRSPASLTPTARSGLNSASDAFTIYNSGQGTLFYNITCDAPWMTVTPASGSSAGPSDPDTIMVTCATSSLPIGTHTGTITITAGGTSNSPQTIAVTLTISPVPGDLNSDNSIDTFDASLFLTCMAGPNVSITDQGCAGADVDGDGDADQSDFGILQKCMNSPGLPANPNCPG